MERIEDVMEYPDDPVFASGKTDTEYKKLGGTLSMRNVTFGYSKLAPPLIENFSLELKQGQRVAFVGTSVVDDKHLPVCVGLGEYTFNRFRYELLAIINGRNNTYRLVL